MLGRLAAAAARAAVRDDRPITGQGEARRGDGREELLLRRGPLALLHPVHIDLMAISARLLPKSRQNYELIKERLPLILRAAHPNVCDRRWNSRDPRRDAFNLAVTLAGDRWHLQRLIELVTDGEAERMEVPPLARHVLQRLVPVAVDGTMAMIRELEKEDVAQKAPNNSFDISALMDELVRHGVAALC